MVYVFLINIYGTSEFRLQSGEKTWRKQGKSFFKYSTRFVDVGL